MSVDVPLLTYALACLLVLVSISDYTRRIIPNVLTYPLLAVGLLLALQQGRGGEAALSAALCLVCVLPLYLGGKLGGGDLKLILGVALCVSWQNAIEILLTSSLIAVVFYLVATAAGSARAEWLRVPVEPISDASCGGATVGASVGESKLMLPLAVPVAAATLFVMVFDLRIVS